MIRSALMEVVVEVVAGLDPYRLRREKVGAWAGMRSGSGLAYQSDEGSGLAALTSRARPLAARGPGPGLEHSTSTPASGSS